MEPYSTIDPQNNENESIQSLEHEEVRNTKINWKSLINSNTQKKQICKTSLKYLLTIITIDIIILFR